MFTVDTISVVCDNDNEIVDETVCETASAQKYDSFSCFLIHVRLSGHV